MEELDDAYVTSIVTLHSVTGALQALQEKDALVRLTHRDDVTTLRKAMRRASGTSVGVVADTVAQVQIWRESLEDFVKATDIAAIHKQKLQRLRCFLDQAESKAKVGDMLQQYKELSFLRAEFPSDNLTVFVDDALQFAKDYLGKAEELVHADTYDQDVTVLRQLLLECEVMWPRDTFFSSSLKQLDSCLAKRMGDQKMMELVSCIKSLKAKLEAKKELTEVKEAVAMHAQLCKGIPLPPAEAEECLGVFDLLCKHCLHDIANASVEKAGVKLAMLEDLTVWWNKQQSMRVSALQSMVNAERALDSFTQEHDSLDAMLAGDDHEKLAQLRRSADVVKEWLEDEELQWAVAELQASWDKVSKTLEGAQDFMKKSATDQLEEALAACKTLMAASDRNGAPWDSGWDAGASWEDTVARCKETLGKVKPEELEKSYQNLTQAEMSCPWVRDGQSGTISSVLEILSLAS